MAVYPVLYSGQRFTSGVATSMQTVYAAKTADTSRASTTSITADPELQADVTTNADYIFHMLIRYSGEPAGDMAVMISGPTGSTGVWGGNIHRTTDANSFDATDTIRTPIGSQRNIGNISIGTSMIINIIGRLKTSTTAGVLSFDWAQVTSNATATVVSADSWFSLSRIG